MVKIRLARGGVKKRPFYPIVVIDSREARDSGNVIEKIGFFNPVATGGEQRLKLDLERVEYWLKVGAQSSYRVNSLIKEARLGSETAATKRQAKLSKKQ